MAGSLTLSSWPGTTGFDPVGYFNEFLEQMQSGMPGGVPGVLSSESDDILGSYSSEFKPYGDSSGMVVKVNQGRYTCKGLIGKIADADAPSGYYSLTVTAAHATLYRIDQVIIETNMATGAMTLKMLDGTAAALVSAVPTALTQNSTTWQDRLGYVAVDPTVTTISVKDVMDARTFSLTTKQLMLALSEPNPIINGEPFVWNDGTTFSSIADGTVGPECWVYRKAGAVVHDLKQSTDVPAVAQNTIVGSYSIWLDVTTADSSIASGDYSALEYRLEGNRAKRILQYGGTLPVWLKVPVLGWYAIALQNSGNDRSCVFDVFVSAATTWTLVFVHVPPSPTAGTWDYDTGTGLRIFIAQACGSTYQATTPGQWVTGDYRGTARTVNANGNTSYDFKVWGLGPYVRGNLVLPFRPQNDERMLTKRYYQVQKAGATYDAFGSGQCSSTTTADFVARMATPMRAAPSVAVSAASDFYVFAASSLTAATGIAALAAGSEAGVSLRATVASGLTAGNGAILSAVTTAATLKLSARLP